MEKMLQLCFGSVLHECAKAAGDTRAAQKLYRGNSLKRKVEAAKWVARVLLHESLWRRERGK